MKGSVVPLVEVGEGESSISGDKSKVGIEARQVGCWLSVLASCISG